MLINKACNTAIVKPNPDYISRISRYIPYRTKTLENLTSQLFPSTCEKAGQIESPISSNRNDYKRQQNIQTQMKCIKDHSLFATNRENKELFNPFTNIMATSDQSHDLLHFRTIGQRNFLQRKSVVILKEPMVQAPIRRHHLKTFSERKRNTCKISS